MTRFARKNTPRGTTKREPEEATPWSQMVQQIKPAVEMGVEDEDDYMDEDGDGDGRVQEDTGTQDSEDSEEEEEAPVRILQQDDLKDEDESDNEDKFEAPFQAEKRKIELVSSDEPKKKKRKKSEKCKVCGSKEHKKMDCDTLSEERRKELQDLYNMKVGRAGMGTGRKKKKKKDKDKLPYEDTEPSDNKSPKIKEESGEDGNSALKPKKNKQKKRKPAKIIKDRTGAVVEEGEGIFQGFRVPKADVKRLQKLYRDFKEKGLTKSELDAVMKKERRNAEKNLARSKKMVCFNCRMPGHMLADCPQEKEGKTQPNSGLCFKCGSLEHKSKDCTSKLKGENAYNYAVCFICKEAGHLAKACPDNPKGLYPKGGGCIFCGSVEHLKRDCPRKMQKDLKSGVKVQTIGDNVEDEPSLAFKPVKKQVKKEKVVAF